MQDFFLGQALNLGRVHGLARLVLADTVFFGLFVVQRQQEGRHRQFAAAVNTNIHMVLGIEFKIKPGAAIGNNAG